MIMRLREYNAKHYYNYCSIYGYSNGKYIYCPLYSPKNFPTSNEKRNYLVYKLPLQSHNENDKSAVYL